MYKQLNAEVGIPAVYPQGTYLRPEADVLLQAFRGRVTAASRHVPPYRTRWFVFIVFTKSVNYTEVLTKIIQKLHTLDVTAYWCSYHCSLIGDETYFFLCEIWNEAEDWWSKDLVFYETSIGNKISHRLQNSDRKYDTSPFTKAEERWHLNIWQMIRRNNEEPEKREKCLTVWTYRLREERAYNNFL
jgi:hypothetical protein